MSSTTSSSSTLTSVVMLTQVVDRMKANFHERFDQHEKGTLDLRSVKRAVENKVSAEFGRGFEASFLAASTEKSLDSFAETVSNAYSDLVTEIFTYKNGAVPSDIALDFCDCFLFRFRGAKSSHYYKFTTSNVIFSNSLVDEFLSKRKAAKASVAEAVEEIRKEDPSLSSSSSSSSSSSFKNNNYRGHRGHRGGGHYNHHQHHGPKTARAEVEGGESKESQQQQQQQEEGEQSSSSSSSRVSSRPPPPPQHENLASEMKSLQKRFPTGFSLDVLSDASAASATSSPNASPKEETEEQHHHNNNKQEETGGEKEGKLTPWVLPAKTPREENFRLARVLDSLFAINKKQEGEKQQQQQQEEGEESKPLLSVTLEALFSFCCSLNAFLRRKKTKKELEKEPKAAGIFHDNPKPEDYNDQRVKRKFERKIWQLVEKQLVSSYLHVSHEAVINIAATIAAGMNQASPLTPGNSGSSATTGGRASAFPTSPATTTSSSSPSSGGGASTSVSAVSSSGSGSGSDSSPPQRYFTYSIPARGKYVTDSSDYDEYFTLVLHFMNKHFQLKPDATRGFENKNYRGHNICGIAVHLPTKRIVGFDFNQSKLDAHLCSHGEKRLCDALSAAIGKETMAKKKMKPPSLGDYGIFSSLEPCNMCCAYSSRAGCRMMGYMQADPMQMNSLEVASHVMGMTVVRPSPTFREAIARPLEQAFESSGYPEEEITSWLGSSECASLLQKLADENPLPPASQALSFFRKFDSKFPGVVVLSQRTAKIPEQTVETGNEKQEEGEGGEEDGMFPTNSLCSHLDMFLAEDEEEEEAEEEAEDEDDDGEQK